MMREVRLYGALGQKFGRRFVLDVATVAEAIRALCANFPDFERHMVESGDRGVGYRVLIGKTPMDGADAVHDPLPMDAPIRIAPFPVGSKKGGLGQIILGLLLIVVTAGQATWMSVALQSTVRSIGVSLLLGGVAQMLAPPPPKTKQVEAVQNMPSYVFDGAVNTAAQGHPVPILYGRMIVGSAVISAGVYDG